MVYIFNAKCSIKSMIHIFILISVCVLLHLWLLNLLKLTDNLHSISSKIKRFNTKKSKDTKHILLWTDYNDRIIRHGKIIFPRLNCSNSNCIFTKKKHNNDYTRFDAIIFNENILNSKDRPLIRNENQIYIFNTQESSYTVPACEVYNDDFFNWTFTHRLDSDVVWTYFVVRNLRGAIVAPSVTAKWRRSSRPVRKKIRANLAGKRKAAAWLVSHCKADSLRDEYLTKLQDHLFHFALKIDVYGKCTSKRCPNDDCDRIIKRDYYFYMAFENSLSEDYATEKVLHGYNNYAVPVVYGGANYSRFLPPSSYINAREMHPYNLAFAMYQAIQTPTLYETYFKWTNLYTVSADFKSDHPLCNLCKRLHGIRNRVEKKRNIKHKKKDKFRLWWNGINGMKWCLSDEYWNETAKVNLDARHIFKLY